MRQAKHEESSWLRRADYELLRKMVEMANCVTGNEPISDSDYLIVDAHHVKLSADRLKKGDGRIYSITIVCTDDSGNSSDQIVTVNVPSKKVKM